MATSTRRPQINHRLCGHAATPAARRACRDARNARQQAADLAVQAEYGYLVGEQVLFYGLDEAGELDEWRRYGTVRGAVDQLGMPQLVVWDHEAYAEVTVCPSMAEHVPATHEKYRADLV